MFSRLFQIFGYVLIPREEADSFVKEKVELLAESGRLRRQVDIFKDSAGSYKKGLIDVRVGDPSPADKEKRASYVGVVAGLHTDILEPKLKQMISNLHEMLESSTNDRDFDQSLKGAVYFAWELIRWGQSMVNEQIANQTNQNPSSSEEVDN